MPGGQGCFQSQVKAAIRRARRHKKNGRGWKFSEFRHPFVCCADISPERGITRPYNILSRPIPALKSKDNHALPARFGEPPARVPHAKTVRRTVSAPLLRFLTAKDFAPCAERPKVLPLETTAFEKAGEILLSGRQFVKNFLFRPTGNFLNHGDSPCNCPQNPY